MKIKNINAVPFDSLKKYKAVINLDCYRNERDSFIRDEAVKKFEFLQIAPEFVTIEEADERIINKLTKKKNNAGSR